MNALAYISRDVGWDPHGCWLAASAPCHSVLSLGYLHDVATWLSSGAGALEENASRKEPPKTRRQLLQNPINHADCPFQSAGRGLPKVMNLGREEPGVGHMPLITAPWETQGGGLQVTGWPEQPRERL